MILRQEGFEYGFDSAKCESCQARCCRGESGYIWVKKEEMVTIADYLGVTFEHFALSYLKKVGYKYSLIEQRIGNEYACIFLDESNRCKIYDVRPTQCRTFPFWESFKQNKEEVVQECPGIL